MPSGAGMTIFFFAERGYRVLAPSLRGHGGSALSQLLSDWSIADLIIDVASVAAGLPSAPVVIGRSMGGFVVQTYLEVHDAPGGVRVASVPPRGLKAMASRHQGSATGLDNATRCGISRGRKNR